MLCMRCGVDDMSFCAECEQHTCSSCVDQLDEHFSHVRNRDGDEEGLFVQELNPSCFGCIVRAENRAALEFLKIAAFREFANGKMLPPEIAIMIVRHVRLL